LTPVQCQLKTPESRRAIDIRPYLLRRLVALVAERGARRSGPLVFASRNGSGLMRKVAREALKRAVKAARLAPPEPSLHDLRHSHASMLIALEVPVVDVQWRLGHRNPTPRCACTRASGRNAMPVAARSASSSVSSFIIATASCSGQP
jgi:integrase